MPAVLLPAAAFVLWPRLQPPPTPRAPGPPRAVVISAAPLPVPAAPPGAVLVLAGAMQLTSSDPYFGGVSGLAATPDGRLLAVTDAGSWLTMRPQLAGGRLVGVQPGAQMGGIVETGTARALREKADLDAEAITVTAAGETLISMEQRHRIIRLAGTGAPRWPLAVQHFAAAAGWPPNGGGEALAALPDGQWLWISEAATLPGGQREALLIAAGGSRARRIAIAGVGGFDPTDAVAVDATHVAVLHRRFTGVETAAAISLVDLTPVLAGGGHAPARLLARWGRGPGWANSWPVDNMEGLALVREGSGAAFYVISDDNFSRLQRTLLLRLNIPAGAGVPVSAAAGMPH